MKFIGKLDNPSGEMGITHMTGKVNPREDCYIGTVL